MPLIINHLADKTVIDIEGVIGSTWEDFFSTDPNKKAITKENMRIELNKLEAVSSDKKIKNILVRINSIGGSCNHGISIHDYLKKSKAKITVEVYGMTCSIAAVISQCASKGKRYISENALFLVHRSWSCFCGCALELQDAIDDLNKIDDVMINLFVSTTGKSKAEIEKIINEKNGIGKFQSSQDAKDNGFFDEVMKLNVQASSASAQNFKDFDAAAMHLPDAPENYSAEKLPELFTASNNPLSRTPPASIIKQEDNKNNNPKQGVKGMKPEEVAKLNDLCGEDNAKFVLDASMDSNSSYEGSLESFVGKLQKDSKAQGELLTSANASLKTANEEKAQLGIDIAALKNEAPPEPAGQVPADNQEGEPPAPPEASATDRWNAAYKVKVDAGMSATDAVQAINKEEPELRGKFLAEKNPSS